MRQVPARPCSRVVSFLIVLVYVLGPPAMATVASRQDDLREWATRFPSTISYDLPAMTLSPDAYPLGGFSVGAGRMLRPVEEAAAFAPVLGIDAEELLRQMRDSGWVTRYISDVLVPTVADPSVPDVVGWSSVTLHDSDAGALEGFRILDETGGRGIEVISMPAREIGEAARLTHASGVDTTGRPFERIRYTFVSGPIVGSVAILWYDTAAIEAVDAEAMVATGERLLDRIDEVVASRSSGLPGLVVRMNPIEGLDIDGYQEMYHVLDGEVIAQLGDSEAAVTRAEAFRDQWGVEANYAFRINFTGSGGGEHRPFYQAQLLRLGSAEDAAALVNGHLQYDQSLGYEHLETLADLPPLDGAVAGIEYVASWPDGSENAGYRIWFQVGAMVVVVEVSAPGGVDQSVAFDLVERQRGCLEFGDCDPVEAPFEVVSTAATPTA